VTTQASVRREVRIGAGADEVWAVVGDPTRLAEWFPGVVSCTVDGTSRVVTTGSGLSPCPRSC
jgi:carbon monoxide dehydrogenase subunit G